MNVLPESLCFDLRMYRQVVFHLIKNALKFSKVGSTIRVYICFVKLQRERNTNPDFKHHFEKLSPIRVPRSESMDWSKNLKELFNSDGYILTKIVDQGEGMDQNQLKAAFSDCLA